MTTTVSAVAEEDLVGTAEISEMLGVVRQYVDRLSRQEGFPAPVAELAAGRVWRRDDVEAWAKATGRGASGADT
jgi:predicted DNA-binding transcriptional regulator AlpA